MPLIYVVAKDAVKGVSKVKHENGGVRGVVSAKNAVGTNPS